MKQYTDIFKALGDATRLRVAAILAQRGETCVCQLAAALEEPDAKISRHLTVMRNAGLVSARREGTWMHYDLCRDSGIIACVEQCLAALAASDAEFAEDLKRLESASCTLPPK